MGRLNVYLPPFAPDYSGACSMLFPMNSMIVIYDASGCTSNYTGFDEPRWFESKGRAFCSSLRETDVALGNDEKYIKRICETAEYYDPELILIAGSPVPLVIGTDFTAIAKAVEERTGIPTFGVSTNGLKEYGEGISDVSQKVMDRFLGDKKASIPRTVNILGMTPLDFTEESLLDLIDFLQSSGWQVNTIMSYELSVDKVKDLTQAELNLASNMGGVDLALWLNKFYDMPYLAGLPVGQVAGQDYLRKMEEIVNEEAPRGHFWTQGEKKEGAKGRIAIIQEAVLANSLARTLAQALPNYEICPASPFKKTCEEFKASTDILYTEREIIDYLHEGGFDLVIADPLILDLLPEGTRGYDYSHFAISSHNFASLQRNPIGKKGDELIEDIKNTILERNLQ